MSVKLGGAPLDPEARAQRRWLITLAITVVFGVFGAVMAYLSYTNRTKPAASSSGRSRSPTAAPTVAPAVAEPSAPAPSENAKRQKADK